MKTLTRILFATAFGAAAISYAGLGPQYWNRPAPNPTRPAIKTATVEQDRPVSVSADPGLTCVRMLVPRVEASKQAPFTVVTCTPEMMKNDWRCQQACAKAKKG